MLLGIIFSLILTPASGAAKLATACGSEHTEARSKQWYLLDQRTPRILRAKPALRGSNKDRSDLGWLFGERDHFHFVNPDASGAWSVGSASSKHVLGVYIKSPMVEFRGLDYTIFLRALFHGALGRVDGIDRPGWLKDEQVAYALHSENGNSDDGTYWAIDGAKFTKNFKKLPPRLQRLPDQFFSLVEKTYRDRLHMKASTIAHLLKISRESFSRSILILKTKQSFIHYGDMQSAKAEAQKPFDVEAGIVVTLSRGAHELLPMELFTGDQVPRFHSISAEVGRFVVDRGTVKDLSMREMQAAGCEV